MAARILIALALMLMLVGWKSDEGVTLDDSSLKSTLTGLGYTPKDLGDGLYEIAVETKELNIPTRVFLAKSKLKIWLSVTVMVKDNVAKLTRDDLSKLLEK